MQRCQCTMQMKIYSLKKQTMLFSLNMTWQSVQGYRCQSGVVVVKCRVTLSLKYWEEKYAFLVFVIRIKNQGDNMSESRSSNVAKIWLVCCKLVIKRVVPFNIQRVDNNQRVYNIQRVVPFNIQRVYNIQRVVPFNIQLKVSRMMMQNKLFERKNINYKLNFKLNFILL